MQWLRTTLIGLAVLLTAVAPAAAAPVRVFAASSLTEAMNDVADRYASTGKPRPTLVFGASSALARQIEAGAPANIFFSADEAWMDYVATKNLIDPASRRALLGNRLVLVVPATAPRRIDIRPGFDFAGLVGDGKWATGDPASVPVGKYAKAALTNLGAWPSVASSLVRAENVRAALAFVETGAAKAGIVYATDARASAKVAVAGEFPPSSHPPIVYPIALVTSGASPEARDFLAYAAGPAAQAIYRARGFDIR